MDLYRAQNERRAAETRRLQRETIKYIERLNKQQADWTAREIREHNLEKERLKARKERKQQKFQSAAQDYRAKHDDTTPAIQGHVPKNTDSWAGVFGIAALAVLVVAFGSNNNGEAGAPKHTPLEGHNGAPLSIVSQFIDQRATQDGVPESMHNALLKSVQNKITEAENDNKALRRVVLGSPHHDTKLVFSFSPHSAGDGASAFVCVSHNGEATHLYHAVQGYLPNGEKYLTISTKFNDVLTGKPQNLQDILNRPGRVYTSCPDTLHGLSRKYPNMPEFARPGASPGQ